MGPETHPIPLAIRAAQGGTPPLAIMGTDYPTLDGTAVRDYIHVTDLAAAHLRALDDLVVGGASTALNLGTGQGYSVRQVVRAIEVASGRPVPLREAPRRAGDPPVLIADPRQAMQRLHWQPQHSGLSQIVETAWRWHLGQRG